MAKKRRKKGNGHGVDQKTNDEVASELTKALDHVEAALDILPGKGARTKRLVTASALLMAVILAGCEAYGYTHIFETGGRF